MNKKGFISTSVVLILFMVFIIVLTGLLTLYSSNRRILKRQKDDIKNSLHLSLINERQKVSINGYYFTIIKYENSQLYLVYDEYLPSNTDLSNWYNVKIGIANGTIKYYINDKNGIKPLIIINNYDKDVNTDIIYINKGESDGDL
jgi:hypothetical protein